MKILNKEMKLNDIVTIGWINKRNCWELVTGRIYDYKSNVYVCIDYSENYVELDDTIKIDVNKIKYIHKMPNTNMWR